MALLWSDQYSLEIPCLVWHFSNLPVGGEVWTASKPAQLPSDVWPLRCGLALLIPLIRWFRHVPRRLSKKEERKWARLQLAIPVFIRTRDGNGKDSLEFATAIN